MNTTFAFKKCRRSLLKYLCLFVCVFISLNQHAQTTWTPLAVPAPDSSGGLMLLLPDGSVLCKTCNGGGDSVGNMWLKLSPDINGSYINGTWSKVCPMADTRLYFSSQLLKNGKVYVAGGEYGSGGSSSELYDPVTNSWTQLPNTNNYYGDANSEILDNGKVLQSHLSTYNGIVIYDPASNTYTNGPNSLGGHDESSWVKLPDNSVLFVDIFSTNSERYIPALNQWIQDAPVPVNLYDPYGFETGPAFLLPDGRAFFMGSLGNTAFYTPSGNSSPGSWTTGPTIPGNNGMPDAPGAMMVDGKIIFAAGPVPTGTNNVFIVPTYFYEFDYTTNTFTPVGAPGGGSTVSDTAFNFTMLDLPDGTVLLTQARTTNYYVHAPAGAPLVIGQPTIASVNQAGCSSTFTLTGLLFNGISEGAMYGDDWQMNTNFPIVRLTSGTTTYYARTHDWNHTGVSTGLLADTTLFDLPPGIPSGTYSLSVIANGISSTPVTFTFLPFPALTSPLFMPDICTGSSFNYTPSVNLPNTTLLWTRAAVAGVSNPAATTPQSGNPNEALFNNSAISKTVVYSYTLSNGSCLTYYAVSVVVHPNLIAIIGPTLICSNTPEKLRASYMTSYAWSTGALTSTIAITPSVTTVYSVTGISDKGCFCSKQVTVTVRPVPTLSTTADVTICVHEALTLAANGSGTSYYWSNTGQITNTILVNPLASTAYTVSSYLPGCRSTTVINVDVEICTALAVTQIDLQNIHIYPNPFKDRFQIEADITETEMVIKVYNLFGQLVVENYCAFLPGSKACIVSMSGLTNGIYFVNVQSSKGSFTAKIIKEE